MSALDCRVQLLKLKPFLDDYLTLSFKEYFLIDPGVKGRGVFIGCGPFPMTALCFLLFDFARQANLLAKLETLLSEDQASYNEHEAFNLLVNLPFDRIEAGVHITCVDSSSHAIKSAAALFDSFGFDKYVSLEHANALDLEDLSRFSFIHLAAMISPRLQVLQSLLERAEAQNVSGQLMLRYVDPDDLRSLLYEPLSLEDLDSVLAESPAVEAHHHYRACKSDKLKTSLIVVRLKAQEEMACAV